MNSTEDTLSSEYGVLNYRGRKYAVGLTWLTATPEDDKKRARARAKKAKGDFYCIRNGVAIQHGIGWLEKGHRANQTAAAAIVADVLVGDWHGIFKADNGWWYLQVFSDVITPDGDLFFESEEEAYHYFVKNHEGRVWAHAYAPKEWELKKVTKELPLDDVLDDMRSASLVPNNMNALFGGTRNKHIAITFFFLVILAGVMAFMGPILWKTLFTPQINSASSAHQKVELPQEIKELPALETPDQEEETVTIIPRPSNFIRICGEVAARLVHPIPGWSLYQMECVPGNIRISWQKKGGTLNMAKEETAKMIQSGAVVTLEENNLVVNRPLPQVPGDETDLLLNTHTAIMQLENRFLNIGSLDIETVIPPPPPPPTAFQLSIGQVPQKKKPHLNVNILSHMSPKVLGNYFDIKGLDLEKIHWEFKENVWAYSAKVFLQE